MFKKIILITFIFIISTSCFAQDFYVYKVKRVLDGDTLELETQNESPLIKKLGLHVRISNIDTPEKTSKCLKERQLAAQAKKFVENLTLNKEILLINPKWDKYARINAIVNYDGIIIGDELIKRNLAVPYFGEKKQKDWCK